MMQAQVKASVQGLTVSGYPAHHHQAFTTRPTTTGLPPVVASLSPVAKFFHQGRHRFYAQAGEDVHSPRQRNNKNKFGVK
eukprot:1143271-Pelagomonas_calceolata.AAC.3